jgi:ppGpp synthetase/RelA/SpoT-type nucleotidyltranferase
MNIPEFEKIYEPQRSGLDRALTELERRLREGIKILQNQRAEEGLHPKLFRIRLREARVKDCVSLFNKINDDPALQFKRAFEPGYIRDLLGARLVCHNLSDVERIVEIFKKAKWPTTLHYVGEKNWLHIPHPESGYRGYHIDVRWESGTAHQFDYAELQIRTLVQDSWAVFIHDDVYKHKADLAITDDLLVQLKEMNNLLYWVDQWAERVRRKVETVPVSPTSHVTATEAAGQAMYAMVGFFRQVGLRPQYKRVTRSDFYEVRADKARFVFKFQGETNRPCEFSFPIGGDTPVANFEIHKVVRTDGGTAHQLTPNEFTITPLKNAVLVIDKQKSKSHDYEIECSWRGVFEQGREYVWCPWADLYPKAEVQYKLSLSFEIHPKEKPRLYRFDEFETLQEISAAFANNSTKGMEATESRVGDKWQYVFAQNRQNLLCLFELGT